MNFEVIEFNEGSSIESDCLVIMPIYNRRHFLEQSFRSLRDQTYLHWNLVIVDDGSTDEPLEILEGLTITLKQRVTYVKQENRGPGAARGTGQEFLGDQKYVAFFDSDDYWLKDYLERGISQLVAVPELDWVFCPCRRVDFDTGETLLDSTLNHDDTHAPLDFQYLATSKCGETFVFEDNHALALTQLRQPIHAGFQNSIISARLAKGVRIPAYRIGEDRHFLMSAILKGFRIGYLRTVGVIYHVHDQNLSDTSGVKSDYGKLISVQNELCRSLLDLQKLTENKDLLIEINREVEKIRFWIIAYHYYWQSGQTSKALYNMFTVVTRNPFNLRYSKTLAFCIFRAPLAMLKKMLGRGH